MRRKVKKNQENRRGGASEYFHMGDYKVYENQKVQRRQKKRGLEVYWQRKGSEIIGGKTLSEMVWEKMFC